MFLACKFISRTHRDGKATDTGGHFVYNADIKQPEPEHLAVINGEELGRSNSGVIGGLAVLAAIIVGILLLRRWCRRRNDTPLVVAERSPQMFTPFMVTPTTTTSMPSRGHPMNLAKYARYAVDASRGGSSSSSWVVDNDAVGGKIDVRTESTTSRVRPAVDLGGPIPAQRREDMSTEEPLRLLNERLQAGAWNDSEDELPPEYDEGRAT
ncbi:hypothetical protein DFS33DRAFT_1273185 [Desarmillaria ectypa]|nr:hypothetical protein DFS33DRAFT_1273185 [Desarmillaria ectypa]